MAPEPRVKVVDPTDEFMLPETVKFCPVPLAKLPVAPRKFMVPLTVTEPVAVIAVVVLIVSVTLTGNKIFANFPPLSMRVGKFTVAKS